MAKMCIKRPSRRRVVVSKRIMYIKPPEIRLTSIIELSCISKLVNNKIRYPSSTAFEHDLILRDDTIRRAYGGAADIARPRSHWAQPKRPGTHTKKPGTSAGQIHE